MLLLKRANFQSFAPNKYTGIGGSVDDNEEIIDSAYRELNEETGIAVIKLIQFARYLDPDYELYYFYGLAPANLKLKCNEGDLEWVHTNELFTKDLIPDTKKVLGEWKSRGFTTSKRFTIYGKHLKGSDSLGGIEVQKVEN